MGRKNIIYKYLIDRQLIKIDKKIRKKVAKKCAGNEKSSTFATANETKQVLKHIVGEVPEW